MPDVHTLTAHVILEPLSRGVPVVSTRVGDALGYYERALWPFCVEPGDRDAAAQAILVLAASYQRYRRRFAANAGELVRRHGEGAERLAELLRPHSSVNGNGTTKAITRPELPVA